MAVLQSPRVVSKFPVRVAHDVGVNRVEAEYAFTANPTAADTIQMVLMPPNAKVTDVALSADRIDTNATPTMTFQVGDGTTANKFVVTTSAATLAGTTVGPPVGLTNAAGFGFVPSTTANWYLTVTVVAAAATFAAGSIRLTVGYTVQA